MIYLAATTYSTGYSDPVLKVRQMKIRTLMLLLCHMLLL